MVFRWQAGNGSLEIVLGSSTEKNCQSWSRLIPFLDAHGGGTHSIFRKRLYVIHLINAYLSSNNKANLSICIKREHLRHKMHLAFNYIPTPRSFSWNLELSTIASEEGPDESVNMWNLDRAFSEVGRRWKFRYLAFRQTKYCRWFMPKMKMVIYYLHAMTLIQTFDNLKKKSSMRRLRFFQRGPTLPFFIVDEEREEPNMPLTVVHNWPSNETPFKWRFAGGPMVA